MLLGAFFCCVGEKWSDKSGFFKFLIDSAADVKKLANQLKLNLMHGR